MAIWFLFLILNVSMWSTDANQRTPMMYTLMKMRSPSRDVEVDSNPSSGPLIDLQTKNHNDFGHVVAGASCAGEDCGGTSGAQTSKKQARSQQMAPEWKHRDNIALSGGLSSAADHGHRTFSGFQVDLERIPGDTKFRGGCAGNGCEVSNADHGPPRSAKGEHVLQAEVGKFVEHGHRTFSGFEMDIENFVGSSARGLGCTGKGCEVANGGQRPAKDKGGQTVFPEGSSSIAPLKRKFSGFQMSREGPADKSAGRHGCGGDGCEVTGTSSRHVSG